MPRRVLSEVDNGHLVTTRTSDGRDLRRVLGRALLIAPAFLIPVLVSAVVDPRHVLRPDDSDERLIARVLLSGLNVVNFDRHDDRMIQKFMLEQMSSHPQVLVLGSSRTLAIDSTAFPGKRVRNASVLAGTLEDAMALYAVARRRGKSETVVIGLDPWILNESADGYLWESIRSDFDSMRVHLRIGEWPFRRRRSHFSRLRTLLSPQYFQESIRTIANLRKREWYSTAATFNPGLTRLPNGSYKIPARVRARSPDVVLDNARRYVGSSMYMIGGYANLDPVRFDALRRFLEHFRADGVSVIIFFPPYHPYVYDYIQAMPSYRKVIETEDAVREFARLKGIPVIGSYDPGRLGLGLADFYDGHHLRDEKIAEILRRGMTRK